MKRNKVKRVVKFVKKWFILYIVSWRLLFYPSSHIIKPLSDVYEYVVIYIFKSVKTSVNAVSLWQQPMGFIHRVSWVTWLHSTWPTTCSMCSATEGKMTENTGFIPDNVLVWVSFLVFSAVLFLFQFVSFGILI